MRARIAIVGGGVMGTSIALHAARRCDPLDEPVVLLERREFGAGSSGRSGSILRQFYSAAALIGMARDSLREYASFEARTGRAIGFTRCGVLTLGGAGSPGSREMVERNIALMRECGVEVERVDARAICALVPGIAVAGDTLGAWEAAAGFVDPQRTVDAFAALARSYGATLRTRQAVRRIRVERGRAVALETDDGVVEAERIVVAAGPWTRRLLLDIGVDLPLRAVRPEQHFLAMPNPARASLDDAFEPATDAEIDPRFARASEPAVAHPVVLDVERGFYTRCEPSRGRTRVGAMDYERDIELDDPDSLDENVGDEFRRWARGALESRMPIYRRERDLDAQAAWYTLTPDAQALIGPCPGVENLFVVSGFSGHGFKLAPSIGAGVAQMLFDEPVGAFDASFFAPARFSGASSQWSGRFGL